MKTTGDLSHEESLFQPQPAGNCLNWIVGHLVVTRGEMLQLLGREPIWSEEEGLSYKRGATALIDPETAHPFDKVRQDFDHSQARVLETLQEATDEILAARAPFSFLGREEDSFKALLAGFAFHESYHVGQTGLLRRLLGHEGIIK
jgi:uncharacterized damage-inducible protein DinB